MKNTILLLTLMTTMNLTANPFTDRGVDNTSLVKQTSQKYFYAKRAADRGNALAQFDLAMMYLKGDNVQQNKKLAFKYFHKAARNNIVEAKFQMGLNFSEGRGVRQQNQLARYWFKLAAKAGHPQAMAYLASIEKRVSPHYGQNRRVAFNFYR